MKVRSWFFTFLSLASFTLAADQDQKQKQTDIKGTYFSPGVGGSLAAYYATEALDKHGFGLGSIVVPVAALGASSVSVPAFALSNWWQGGKEYLSSSYWPSYLSFLGGLYGFGLHRYGAISGTGRLVAMLALMNATRALSKGHQSEREKKEKEAQLQKEQGKTKEAFVTKKIDGITQVDQ